MAYNMNSTTDLLDQLVEEARMIKQQRQSQDIFGIGIPVSKEYMERTDEQELEIQRRLNQ